MANQFCGRTRREFLWEAGGGFAGLALLSLLDTDGFFSRVASGAPVPQATSINPLLVKPPHFAPRARSCIFLFMYGGPSQMDLFDYKPELQKNDGKTVSLELRRHSNQ